MPVVDEDTQDRETFGGNPKGWSANRSVIPEGQSPKDVVKDRVPEPDEPEESSTSEPDESPESQEETAQPSQPEEDQEQVKKPSQDRYHELVQQRREAEDRAQRAETMARMALEKFQQPKAPELPQEDPWKGLVDNPDPATAQFWQQQRKLFQFENERAIKGQLQGIQQTIDAGRQELVGIKVQQFLKENPEIKPGSQELGEITTYVNQGYDLETAKQKTLFTKLEAENRMLKSKQSGKTQKRMAANSESSSGITTRAALPGRRRSSEERAGEVVDKGGSIRDVARAFFGPSG